MQRPDDVPEWAWERSAEPFVEAILDDNDAVSEEVSQISEDAKQVLREQIAHALVEEREGQWNFDMSKAPRDGTPVLLGDNRSMVAMGFYQNSEWHFWEGDYSPDEDPGDSDNLAVVLNGWLLGAGPKCWRPLPTPPSIRKEG